MHRIIGNRKAAQPPRSEPQANGGGPPQSKAAQPPRSEPARPKAAQRAEGERRSHGRANEGGSPRIWLQGAVVAAAVLALSGVASADSASCREWSAEHVQWKTEVMRRFLGGAPQRAVDEAVFEMLQREAYLTACDIPVEVARCEMVGWRLGERPADEYASAVLESVLDQAGFEVELRELFELELFDSRTAADPRDDSRS